MRAGPTSRIWTRRFSVAGCGRASERKPSTRHRTSVRAAGPRREEMIDGAAVIAEYVAVAHAKPVAFGDHDAPRLEQFGRFLDGVAPVVHAEVGAHGAQRFNDRIGARLEIAPRN